MLGGDGFFSTCAKTMQCSRRHRQSESRQRRLSQTVLWLLGPRLGILDALRIRAGPHARTSTLSVHMGSRWSIRTTGNG